MREQRAEAKELRLPRLMRRTEIIERDGHVIEGKLRTLQRGKYGDPDYTVTVELRKVRDRIFLPGTREKRVGFWDRHVGDEHSAENSLKGFMEEAEATLNERVNGE